MTAPAVKLPPFCPYCGQRSKPATGAEVYPRRADLQRKLFFVCAPCDARVGAHPSGEPFGRLANAELRAAKMRAHDAFDPLWRDGSQLRRDAYQWLANQLGKTRKATHIGMFDVDDCARVVAICEAERARRAAGTAT